MTASQFERQAFETLNAFVEPLVRAGIGGPWLAPFGMVVLETRGRRSGQVRRTPLLAAVAGRIVVVSTFRGRQAQWVKNLVAAGEASWWLNGARRSGPATVLGPDVTALETDLPESLRGCFDT